MEPGKFYHIYTHANGFENLFRENENYRYFLERYSNYIPDVADTWAWCLMPNHIHFLVQVKNEKELGEFLRRKMEEENASHLTGLEDQSDVKHLSNKVILQFSHLFNSYTKSFNKRYKRRGSLFTRAFNRKEISSDHHLSTVIRYIHRNPVHHGFAGHPGDWAWSSFPKILSGNSPAWISADKIIQWFGSREAFSRFHEITERDEYTI
jgi:putative transposase